MLLKEKESDNHGVPGERWPLLDGEEGPERAMAADSSWAACLSTY